MTGTANWVASSIESHPNCSQWTLRHPHWSPHCRVCFPMFIYYTYQTRCISSPRSFGGSRADLQLISGIAPMHHLRVRYMGVPDIPSVQPIGRNPYKYILVAWTSLNMSIFGIGWVNKEWTCILWLNRRLVCWDRWSYSLKYARRPRRKWEQVFLELI